VSTRSAARDAAVPAQAGYERYAGRVQGRQGPRNAGQFRIDIQNFGNMLNSNWGVGQRVIRNNILTTPTSTPTARWLPHAGRQQRSWSARLRIDARNLDVYQFMLSFRYSFN
jgi:hypothetical protein